MTDTIIKVTNVTKSFGGVVANRNVSLSVPRGRITGLIGPNGSGKTTLFNSIVGYHPIDSGSIRFEGQEISQLRVQEIARLGLLRTFQTTRIYGKMSCLQNMQISIPHRKVGFLDMFAYERADVIERAEHLLSFVGLYEKRFLRAGSLSFGQQKLLEFAMALMNEPTGLSGFANAGSPVSTTVCVTSVTTCFVMPRRFNALTIAFWNMKPIAPCVSATA